MSTTATATRYQGTFRGRADEIARVRKEIAAHLGTCPVADDLVLIADEFASNAVLHTRSRDGSFQARCELSAGRRGSRSRTWEARGAPASRMTGPTDWTPNCGRYCKSSARTKPRAPDEHPRHRRRPARHLDHGQGHPTRREDV